MSEPEQTEADKAKTEAAKPKPVADKPKAEAKAKLSAEPEHDDPYPSQAQIDEIRLGKANAGDYVTRDLKAE